MEDNIQKKESTRYPKLLPLTPEVRSKCSDAFNDIIERVKERHLS